MMTSKTPERIGLDDRMLDAIYDLLKHHVSLSGVVRTANGVEFENMTGERRYEVVVRETERP